MKGAQGQSPLKLPGTARIKADARFDTEDLYGGDRGVGIFLDMRKEDNANHLAYRMYYSQATANAVYPPITDLAEVSLQECVGSPKPFLSTIFGARTASRTHLAAKGFVQSSPLVNHTIMRGSGANRYLGVLHPVNSPFDYSFEKHAPAGDSLLPNADDTTNRGYIMTGFTKADGLSRCVIAELPVQPLASLAELTHWDARFENPAPPYSLNQIANSDATPLIRADGVTNSQHEGIPTNYQHDDSYCMNHLLFDDWFVSSITPDSKLPGSDGRSQKQAYLDFLSGETPLTNRSYIPIAEDAAVTAAAADALYASHVEPVNSWKTIASRLEVKGMFNVNSTSVKAWRALLGHARNQKVPHIREVGASWDLHLSAPSDHVLSRFSIAADTEAGTAGSSGAFPEATQFAGYRTVDDAFLDAMAEEVVAQVRLRGPFLSLSEFVNRHLSDGEIALAGTIQAALNKISGNPASDPFADLKALSTLSTQDPPNAAGIDEEYQFRAAAVGHSTYGLPGWTRQADILRPLAPILSARDDTFTIRAYGDARDSTGAVLAKAWCEATVRRTRDFVDPADPADRIDTPSSDTNLTFGRRYEIVSFRWLSPDEV